MLNPLERYQKRQERYNRLVINLTRRADRISNLRLVVFILGGALAFSVYRIGYPRVSAIAGLLAIFGFVYLVIQHSYIIRAKKYAVNLTKINEDAMKRFDSRWTTFTDTGEDFLDHTLHPFSSDLDIFGHGSLFQWVNTTQTLLGRAELRKLLAHQPDSQERIRLRQEAVLELASHVAWRQRFIAEGIVSDSNTANPEPLFCWAEETNNFYRSPYLKVIVTLGPLLTISLIIIYLVTHAIPVYCPLVMALTQAVALFLPGKKRSRALAEVSKYESSLKAYYRMIKHMETKPFQAKLLQSLQDKLKSRDDRPAFAQLEQLAKIVDYISNRLNAIFLVVNILTLWDYHCMIALENWKHKSGRLLATWLHTVGELEALASLALIAHDHPNWVVPVVRSGEPFLSARAVGHPLLTKERVDNDLTLRSPSGILLITGSNMSGKSTLLRTAGINLVLAYAGATVCAVEFSCALMRVYTCMRVSDNLEQSISSFYAELLRIKMIVEAAKDHSLPIFFLMDEIFNGTNSQDRHTGAKLLIQQLGKEGAVGLVSTHDLELGELEGESGGRIRNHHFREFYQNGQIHFDYKLRPGISTTRNALYLIKMAGIEVDL